MYDIKDFQAQSLTGNSILGEILKAKQQQFNLSHAFFEDIAADLRKENQNAQCFVFFPSPFAAQYAGEDPVVALEAALQFEDTRESMQAFCVGQYMEVSTIKTLTFTSANKSIFPMFLR